jgi:hypothetical protein
MESGLGSGPTGYFMDASRLDEEFPQVDPGKGVPPLVFERVERAFCQGAACCVIGWMLDLAVPAWLPAVPTGLGRGLSLR